MRINNNISALNAWRNMTQTDFAMSKSLERLSSGFRINRAADDAAGLAISEKMRGQIRGLNQAVRNAQDAISLIQTAEGALNESHSIVQRVRELATQAASDTNTAGDRWQLQQEASQLTEEVSRIAGSTEFNTKKLLDGSFTNGTFQIGANAGQKMEVTISAMDAAALSLEGAGQTTFEKGTSDLDVTAATNSSGDLITGAYTAVVGAAGAIELFSADGTSLGTGTIAANTVSIAVADTAYSTTGAATAVVLNFDGATGVAGTVTMYNLAANEAVSVMTQDDADDAISLLDSATNKISSQRAQLGAYQNRLEHTIANLSVAAENLTAAESRIRDVDMASEMAVFTRNQILLQAGTAMMAQANQKPQAVLQLLR